MLCARSCVGGSRHFARSAIILAGSFCLELRCLQRIINAAFELAVELDGLMVGKWQNLGQDYTCHALLRIEPIVRIIDAGPGEAAGATAIGPWLRIDHVAETPFARNAREEI